MFKQLVPRLIGMFLLLTVTVIMVACSSADQTDTPATGSDVATVASTEEAEAEEAPAEEAPAEPAAESAAASADALTFTIVQEGTEARFSIYELLMGQDKTVIGTTSAVEGSISVDPAAPSSAVISPIRIDASTLATDSDRRNGAIQRWILESNQEQYQYIVFTPTAIEGMPESVSIGESFSFTVVGDLTIRDITKQETFQLTVTANSENELSGLGQTTIMRGDYNLTIPSVPSVANVGEEVPLEIEFRATSS